MFALHREYHDHHDGSLTTMGTDDMAQSLSNVITPPGSIGPADDHALAWIVAFSKQDAL